MVDVLSLLSLSEDINLWANLSLSNLWELSLNVECKSSELFNIDTSTSSNIVIQVLDQGFPDNDHLGFWLQWLQVCRCSLS